MDTARLKTFLEIYRVRHFGKTAERLFITPSAASARIKLLEEQLGVKLFTRRSHHSVIPTIAGQRLLKYTETVVNNWEYALQNVGLPGDFQQNIHIGCLSAIWHLYLLREFARVQSALQASALSLSIHPAHLLTEQVLQGSLDLAFNFEPVHTPQMTYLKLPPLQLILQSTVTPISLDDALNERYIMIDWGTAFQFEYNQLINHSVRPTLYVNSGMMALDILHNQNGAAYLSAQISQHHSVTAKLYPVESAPVFEREIYAVYRHDNAHYELIQRLIDILNAPA